MSDEKMESDPLQLEVLNIVQSLNNGEEPILLKICSGNATPDEISSWAETEGIDPSDIQETISMMTESFSMGTQIAKDMNEQLEVETKEFQEITNQVKHGKYSPDEVMIKLNLILDQLNDIKDEITHLISRMKP
jgi:hypothetical protein